MDESVYVSDVSDTELVTSLCAWKEKYEKVMNVATYRVICDVSHKSNIRRISNILLENCDGKMIKKTYRAIVLTLCRK